MNLNRRRRMSPALTCGAVLWKNGNRCRNEAAPGSVYCPAHLCLLAPLEWVTGGYSRVLDPAATPTFHSAAYATLSEEVALARLQLIALLRDNAPPSEVVTAITAVASVVRLQAGIERAARARQRRFLKQEATRRERLRQLDRALEQASDAAPDFYGDPDPRYVDAVDDLTPRR